jgi:hypothetical protein
MFTELTIFTLIIANLLKIFLRRTDQIRRVIFGLELILNGSGLPIPIALSPLIPILLENLKQFSI